jgi:hypothetical protein
MNLQHINVKIMIANPQEVELEPFINIFHRWIQNKIAEEMLVDVADYAHVPAGPGVLLVAHEANMSIDNAENRLGFLYNRKTVMNGTNLERLQKIFKTALLHCQRLEEEASVKGKLKFQGGDMQLIVNDRLLVPNNEESLKVLEPELKDFFNQLYAGASYTLKRHTDSRERFTLDVKASQSFEVATLLKNLS